MISGCPPPLFCFLKSRKRDAFLQITRIIHKCLTIDVKPRQSCQESPPTGIWKRCFIFLLGVSKKKSKETCCLCLVQEVTLIPFHFIFNLNYVTIIFISSTFEFFNQTFCLLFHCHVQNLIYDFCFSLNFLFKLFQPQTGLPPSAIMCMPFYLMSIT